MNRRQAKIVVETDRHRISGNVNLPSEGYRSRLSDHLNRDDLGFLTIVDAQVTTLDSGESWSAPVLMVARRHMRYAVPVDDS